jgi:hypothetical protein
LRARKAARAHRGDRALTPGIASGRIAPTYPHVPQRRIDPVAAAAIEPKRRVFAPAPAAAPQRRRRPPA